jgi:succinate dehydrogenase/fumarate reductase-like Fe-S protein
MTTTTDTVMLRIRRFDGRSSWWEDVAIPLTPGMTYLDALRWIREHVDPNLGFDFACITNNSCKLCQLRIDGAPAYSCATRIEPGQHVLEPIDPDKTLVDLFQRRDGVW